MALFKANADMPFLYNNDQLLQQGMWQDHQTGLVWSRCPLGQQWQGSACTGSAQKLTWKEAVLDTNKLPYFNHSGWRLPTADELTDLLNHGATHGFQTAYLPDAGLKYDQLWTLSHTTSTATTVQRDGQAYAAKISELTDGAYVYAVQSGNLQQKAEFFNIVSQLDASSESHSSGAGLDSLGIFLYGMAVLFALLIVGGLYYYKRHRTTI